MTVTLDEFAVKAHGLGKAAEIVAVLEFVENQLFEIIDDMRHDGVVITGERQIATNDAKYVTPVFSIFNGANEETTELRKIAHSFVRMRTAHSLFTDEDKMVIGNAAFDDVLSAVMEGYNADSALGIHHAVFKPRLP